MPRLTPKKSIKRKTTQLSLWVSPQIKAELQHIAEEEGLTVSKAGATFIEKAIRQKLHSRHSVLLQPIIETAIHKEMAKHSTRLALLLVRVAFDAGQTRSIVANMLSRKVTPEALIQILEGSSRTAKSNITRKTPQLETIIDEVAQWFKDEKKQTV